MTEASEASPLSAHARLHRAYMRYLETDDGVNSPDLGGFGDSVLRIIRDVFDEHDDMDLEMAALQAQVAELTREKNGAYLERNQVVAALAQCFPSGVARTAIEGWAEEWHGCVYIDLPTGQASWHFHESQADLFAGLSPYTGAWDGHDTPEKYRRLAALADGSKEG